MISKRIAFCFSLFLIIYLSCRWQENSSDYSIDPIISSTSTISTSEQDLQRDTSQAPEVQFSWYDLSQYQELTIQKLKHDRPDIWTKMKHRLGEHFDQFIEIIWTTDGKWKVVGDKFNTRFYCLGQFNNSFNPEDGYAISGIFIDPIENAVSGIFSAYKMDSPSTAHIEGGINPLPEVIDATEKYLLNDENIPLAKWTIEDYYRATYISYLFPYQLDNNSGIFQNKFDSDHEFEGIVDTLNNYISFETFRGTGEGNIKAHMQTLPHENAILIYTTEQSDGIWSSTSLSIQKYRSFYTKNELSLKEVGLDSLFESIFPMSIWHWPTSLRERLLPLQYNIIDPHEIILEIKPIIENFEICKSAYSSNPKWHIYADLFTNELTSDMYESILKSGSAVLYYSWNKSSGKFEKR